MESIKIKSLRLENFKCHRKLELAFDGRDASIYGDNATGKTSIYDAMTWLLFGKDSHGNGEKNIDIKPLNAAGEVADHQAVTEVEAVLLVNGEEVALHRTYQEVWTTKRGSSEATYDGNTSEYFVDGVPCKKNAFDSKIKEIVPEDTFRMLTSVSYFANDLPWQKRREILFDIAGVVDDKTIMETNGAFAPLLDGMGRLNLTDYKAKLLAEKRGLVGARNEIPARISECQKTVEDLASLDFAGAKAEAEVLNARKEQIAGELIALDRNTAADGKRMELREAQLELDKLENENRRYLDSQKQGLPDILALKSELRWTENKVASCQKMQQSARSGISGMDARIQEARAKWMDVNGETFTGGNCPTCGQTLPAAQLKASHDRFEAQKQRRLQSIVQDSETCKQMKADYETQLAQYEKEQAQYAEEITRLREQIQTAERFAAAVTEKDMDGYAEKAAGIHNWISQLQNELHKISQDSYAAGEGLRQELNSLKAQISEKMALVSKESALDYARGRIEELRSDAAASAEKLQKVEQMLYLMDEFSRYKTGFVEDSVNSAFRIARFRLFREQANGGVEDRCDVTYGGVPYMGLNNGMKINVGIDIINALSRAYGVTVPLFVDNAESVTRLESSDTQIIRLVVSEQDKELRVNYEN